jgi:DNA-binding MarR family transcriptional regulator
MTGKRTQSPKTLPPKTLRADARRALETCAGWNLRLAARRATQFLEERMEKSGVSLSQFGLMAEIASAEDDTVSALAVRMGLDQSTLSRTLRTLEGDGLVEIAIVESDQRKRMVWLTEKGARRLEAALGAWREAHAALARHLSVDLVHRVAQEAEAL